ncbi:hypothetical protein [Halobacteriovorax sp. RT-2-6]|uniref:hypothetical protein n=1 Tax=unclassified Halobacteriovorax TaxID=2639665 RepID=UPI00399A3C60
MSKLLKRVFLLLSVLSLLASCSSINSYQAREYAEWKAKGLEVKEKDETLAAVLNILPGVGDFYNGDVPNGVINLLFWPLSVAWAPAGGAQGAKVRNYHATKAHVDSLEKNKKALLSELDTAFMTNMISKKAYIIGKQKITSMDLIEFRSGVRLQDVLTAPLNRLPASKK